MAVPLAPPHLWRPLSGREKAGEEVGGGLTPVLDVRP